MFCNLVWYILFFLLASSCFLFQVYCDRFCWSLYYSHSTNHAGVIMCCCHVSPSTNVMYNVMISDVYTNYYLLLKWILERGWWKSANVNLQKEGMFKLSLYAFLLWPNQCHVLPPLSPKCLFKESRWMTTTWSGMDCHSNVCVWKKILWNWCQC